MKQPLLFFIGSLLFSCAAPLPPSAESNPTPAPQAATPPPVVVEKIQLQAGSNDPLAITELRVDPSQLELQTHEVAKIRVLARLANGQTVEVINHSKLNWQLADPAQLSLFNGTLKALQAGESDVVIRAGNQETRLKVKVFAPNGSGTTSKNTVEQSELVLPQPLYRLAVGENVYLQASLKQPDGSESQDLIFSVDKPDLFELDSKTGRLRRLKAGAATVTIQARLNGDVVKTIAVEDKVIESSSSGGGGGAGNSLVAGGNVSTPQSTPTATPIPSNTATPLPSPTPQPTSTATPTPNSSAAPLPSPTPQATQSPVATPVPTPTAILIPTPTPPSVTIFPPKIAFMARDPIQNDREIYLINTDGGGLFNLTQNTLDDRAPSWSSIKQKILYTRYNGTYYHIMQINVDGTGSSSVFSDGSQPYTLAVIDASWPPAGDKVTYVAWNNNRYDLYLSSLLPIQTRALTSIYLDRNSPRFSPDGIRIAFAQYHPVNQKKNIYIINSDGTQLRQLTGTTNNTIEENYPAWKADGSEIAFWSSRRNAEQPSGIYSIKSDGTQLRLIAETPDGSRSLDWSPDMLYFLCTTKQNSDKFANIYIYNLESETWTRVTDDSRDHYEAVWVY